MRSDACTRPRRGQRPGAAGRAPRRAAPAGRRRLRRGETPLERRPRRGRAGRDRPLHRPGRRDRGARLRPCQRPDRRRARRRPQHPRLLDVRRRHGDRPRPDAERPRRPGGPPRVRRRRRALGRRRPRVAAVRPRDDRRARLDHRRRRLHARRRHRLADAPVRPRLPTTSSAPTSSPPTAGSCTRARTENSDLFWGLRGGGGNFGIVTVVRARAAPGRARGLRRAAVPARRRPPAICCASTATGRRTRPTRSRPRSASRPRRRCR